MMAKKHELAMNNMEEIAKAHEHDPEACHSEADDLLCKILRSEGYDDMINIFESMEKWYA